MRKPSWSHLLGAVTCVLSIAGYTQAEEMSNWYFNPAIGIENYDHDRDLDDAGVISLGLEYRYNDHWASELRISEASADAKYGQNDVDTMRLFVDGLYYFRRGNGFEPFVTMGLGHADYDGDIRDDQETEIAAGVGTRYTFNERWSARFDLKTFFGVDDDTFDNTALVGISYAFGSSSSQRAAQKAPPPPAPIAEPDSDGDGVIDRDDRCPGTAPGTSVDPQGCDINADADGDGVADRLDQCPDSPAGVTVDASGCPIAVEEKVSERFNILFELNSASVSESSQSEMARLADFLKRYGKIAATIEGHTDSSGSAAYNKSLSQKRADAVRQQLVDRYGIDAARLSAQGFGEDRPIASNDTADGRKLNRRVVVVLEN